MQDQSFSEYDIGTKLFGKDTHCVKEESDSIRPKS